MTSPGVTFHLSYKIVGAVLLNSFRVNQTEDAAPGTICKNPISPGTLVTITSSYPRSVIYEEFR